MSQFQTTQEDWSLDYSDKFMDVRRQKYLRRASAARKVQAMFRRYKAGSKDRRDLANVVRSHRKANPYQIQPSSGRTVSFWRKTQVSIPLGQTGGWNGAGNNINWGFGLGRIVAFTDGVFSNSLQVPNASDFQNLFDYYMIKNVKMTLFFTKNTDSIQTSGNTFGLPILQIANDFDDVQETMTLNSMNERVGCRHVQFDSNNTNGINHYVKPKPSSVVVQTDVITGAQSTANAGIVFGTQWLDVAQSNIIHNGIKVFYVNQGLTTVATLGTVTFVFDVEYVFKGYR